MQTVQEVRDVTKVDRIGVFFSFLSLSLGLPDCAFCFRLLSLFVAGPPFSASFSILLSLSLTDSCASFLPSVSFTFFSLPSYLRSPSCLCLSTLPPPSLPF